MRTRTTVFLSCLAFCFFLIILGPVHKPFALSADEARDFEKKWAVMADFPTPQAVDYLNKLNPHMTLLDQVRNVTEALFKFGALGK